MQLLILAAGMGRRLDPLTRTTPKCLVPVNGVPILCSVLDHFSHFELERIVIVIGHLGDMVREAIGNRHGKTPVYYVENPVPGRTNNIYSLWLARNFCDHDTVLMEADVLFEQAIAAQLCARPIQNIALVDTFKPYMDGTVVEVDDQMKICDLTSFAQQSEDFDYRGKYKTVNLYSFRADYLQGTFLPALRDYMTVHGKDKYYELVISALLINGDTQISASLVAGKKWIEVDDFVDLERAEILFSEPARVYRQVAGLYGGFWRYNFVDYSYLYNLYFPPADMFAELKRNMSQVLRHYPSGSQEILRYLQHWVGVPADRLIIGNGASEIIAALKRTVVSKMTIPAPTYNEYYDRLPGHQVNFYYSEPTDFVIDMEAFTAAVEGSGSNVAVIVNPDLPSGILAKKSDLEKLLSSLAHIDLVIVDESFMEFATAETDISLLGSLQRHPNLLVIRSLSKDLGTPGLRLGYAASANSSLVELLRAEIPIWNINSVAELFLAILPKYRRQFEESRQLVAADRQYMYSRLGEIPEIKTIPSSANFFLLKLPEYCPSDKLREYLFVQGNMLVKDCSNKAGLESGRYIRVAVRTSQETDKFIEYLSASLSHFSAVNQ